jgi:hypothetical protein
MTVLFIAQSTGEDVPVPMASNAVMRQIPRTLIASSSVGDYAASPGGLQPGGAQNFMRRWFAILGSLFFLVLAPGTVAGLAPGWISRRSPWRRV